MVCPKGKGISIIEVIIMLDTHSTFCHETAWFRYCYIQDAQQICIIVKDVEPVILYVYTKEELLDLIPLNHLNLYLLPILKKALSYFPKETNQ